MKNISQRKETAFLFGVLAVVVSAGLLLDSFDFVQGSTVTVSATVGTSVTCSTDSSSVAFGTLTTGGVSTASPNASTTMTCNTGLGCSLSVNDAGDGANPGLATSSPAYLIPSATAALSAGTEGYGIQGATTTAGSGGILGINGTYLKTGNNVGGLLRTTVTLASSTASITNREVVVTHKAAISSATQAASYTDTITYSCAGN